MPCDCALWLPRGPNPQCEQLVGELEEGKAIGPEETGGLAPDLPRSRRGWNAIGIRDPGVRQLLEERRALEALIPRMALSMSRGPDWLISELAPHGSIARERDVSHPHKVTWGLYEDGRLEAAERVLDWLAWHARMGTGRYAFPEEPPFSREFQLLHRFLTFGRAAERLRHAVLAKDETGEEILTYQHPCGGVYGNKDGADVTIDRRGWATVGRPLRGLRSGEGAAATAPQACGGAMRLGPFREWIVAWDGPASRPWMGEARAMSRS